MIRQQWLVFVPMALVTAGLGSCASMLGGETVKVRPVDTSTLTGPPRDVLYESAVSAINERDYGRALEYLQAAKAKDPRNVKALNALGVVYDKLGRFDLSARYYAQAQAIEPGSRIVAENMGYSGILQRLLNPGQQVAVATIDLPPGLNNPASPVAAAPPAPVAAGTQVADTAAPPAITVPLVTVTRVIDTQRPAMTATPLVLQDTKPLFASIVIPEPPMTVVERRLIDTPPPTVTAMPVALPDSKRLFAEIVLPEPVVPVKEKKVIDTPRSAVTVSPFVLPDTKPLFAASLSPAVLSLADPAAERMAPAEAVASAATMTVASTRPVTATPVSPMSLALVMPAIEQKPMVEPAPSAAAAPVAPSAKPAIAAMSGSSVSPQAEAKSVVAPVPAVLAVPAAKPAPVMMASAAPMVEKKALATSVSSPAVVPVAPPSAKPAVAVPVRAIAAAPVKRIVEKPVIVASAPVAVRAAVPAWPARQVAPAAPVKQVANKGMPAKGKLLTIGQPIKLVNASGKPAGAGPVLRRLTSLGWTMRPDDSRSQAATVLFYPTKNLAAAKAMQRTLPFPVKLIADSGKVSSMRLVIGRDYLSWKPKNSRIAALWQKRTIIASTQKTSFRGVR